MWAAARRVARHAGISILGALLASPAAADASLEYKVKAAYLAKFIPFITWPDGTFASATAPVTICVLGDGPFGGTLDQAAAAGKSGDRAITVRHVSAPDAGCQLLFLGEGGEGAADALRVKPVVTVTDSGVTPPGVISFIVAENHVRFDIDDAAAAADNIKISSKLLELAQAVRRRSAP